MLGLAACGGRTAIPLEDTSDSGGGSKSVGSTSTPSPAPAVGSSACQMTDSTCVLCADGNFHCNSEILSPCLPHVYDESCVEFIDGGIGTCLDCSDGIATLFRCYPGNRELIVTESSTCIQ